MLSPLLQVCMFTSYLSKPKAKSCSSVLPYFARHGSKVTPAKRINLMGNESLSGQANRVCTTYSTYSWVQATLQARASTGSCNVLFYNIISHTPLATCCKVHLVFFLALSFYNLIPFPASLRYLSPPELKDFSTSDF